jgi:kynurenine formamidase
MSGVGEGGNWGRWGDEDERGTLNLLTPEVVLEALKSCKTGKVYSLGLPIQRSGVPNLEYRGIPQRLTLINHDDERMFVEGFGGPPGVGAHEDVLVMGSHTVTHMDALCHVYAQGALYNGHPHNSMAPYSGAAYCGIEKAGGVAARGVLIDVAAHKGVATLDPGYVITAADVTGALDAQGVTLRAGDAALVRTGWTEWFMAGNEMTLDQPGIGFEVAELLGDADVALVAADNSAVEAMPFDRDEFLGIHIEMLVKRGIHLLEHVHLAELSADKCYESLFCVGPLRVTGATASPVNPIAIG